MYDLTDSTLNSSFLFLSANSYLTSLPEEAISYGQNSEAKISYYVFLEEEEKFLPSLKEQIK